MSDQLALRCGYCERKLRIPSVLAGRKGMCPKCNVRFMVPTPADVLAALPERFVCMPVGTPPPQARSKAELRESSADDTIEIPSLNALRGDPDVDRLLDAIESSKRGDFEPAPAPRRQSLDDLLDGPQVVYDGAAPSRRPPTPQPQVRPAKGPQLPARPASSPILPVVKPGAPPAAARAPSAPPTPRPTTTAPPAARPPAAAPATPRPATAVPPSPRPTATPLQAAPVVRPATPPAVVPPKAHGAAPHGAAPHGPAPHGAASSSGDDSIIAEPAWVFEPGATTPAPERLLDLSAHALEPEEPFEHLNLDSPPSPQPAVVFETPPATAPAPPAAWRQTTTPTATPFPVVAPPRDDEPTPAGGHAAPVVPACGFEIRAGHILVAYTPKLAWYREQLLGMLLALDARASAPGVLDLSHADRVDTPMLRRAAMAVLYAEMSGKPIKLHVNENQMALVRDLGLDRLIPCSFAPRGGTFDSDTGKFSKSHVDDLLEQSKDDVLPANVVNQQFEDFSRGSYTTRLRSVERKLPPGMAPAEEAVPPPAAAPPVYSGPDRRTEDRFCVEDAEVVLRIGEEALAASLEDISVKGARLTARRRLSAGDLLEVTIAVSHVVNAFTVEARAVWCVPAEDAAVHDPAGLHRLAVFFTSVPGASMIKLRRLEGKFLQ